MAVTIADQRTIFNEADATTNWSGSPSLFTSEPNPVESTGCIGYVVSNATVNGYVPGTSANLTSSLVYVWVRPFGSMDTVANGGVGVIVGDGTNIMAYYVGGSDKSGFRHTDGPVEWTCFILDTTALPTSKATIAGSEASMNWSAITQIGARFKTLFKAVGGVSNCYVDIIRHGTGGLTVTGGGSGTEGTFAEIATADRSTANQQAFGVCRQLATGVVGLQGPLTLGDNAGTGSIDFESSGETVVFEPPPAGVATSRFWITVTGNATGTGSVVLTGCAFICPAGTGAAFTASDSDVDTFTLDGCTLKGFEQGVTFLGATTTNTHTVQDCVFDGCGQIAPQFLLQDGTFDGVTINGSTASATGALLLGATGYTSGVTLGNLLVNSGGSGHGIYITQAGTYTFSNVKGVGFGADATANAFIYNNSGGAVTINATNGCSGLTVLNGSGASTTINNSVNVKITAVTTTGTPISGARVFLETVSGGTDIFDGSDATSLTDANGEVSTTWNYTADVAVTGRVRKGSSSPYYRTGQIVGTIGATGFDVTIVLVRDE